MKADAERAAAERAEVERAATEKANLERAAKKAGMERAAAEKADMDEDKKLAACRTRSRTRPRLRECHGPSHHLSRSPLQAACPSHRTSPISAAEVTIEKAEVERAAASATQGPVGTRTL